MNFQLFKKNAASAASLFLLLLLIILLSSQENAYAQPQPNTQSKVKDLTRVQAVQERLLTGYGLVVGLDRSGDRAIRGQGSAFTVQSIVNMLQNYGINVDGSFLRTRNVAAVMVTARLSPYNVEGGTIDVTVSSLGDATSLAGGQLLQTPLIDPDGNQFLVKAQGALLVGGYTSSMQGASIRSNMSLTGTIPNGGIVIGNNRFELDFSAPLGLAILDPDPTTAQSISDAINATVPNAEANVLHAGYIEVLYPPDITSSGQANAFLSSVLAVEVTVSMDPTVVINERTGTIVAGGRVLIEEVMITHGNIKIQSTVTPFISQPPAFSGGVTISGGLPTMNVKEDQAQTVLLDPKTTVAQLSAALNQLELTPRDIIAIFQALNRAGALRGELIIM
jgi:flagellar P-ring protein precursor FlgI